jgi:hypothetical protein
MELKSLMQIRGLAQCKPRTFTVWGQQLALDHPLDDSEKPLSSVVCSSQVNRLCSNPH